MKCAVRGRVTSSFESKMLVSTKHLPSQELCKREKKTGVKCLRCVLSEERTGQLYFTAAGTSNLKAAVSRPKGAQDQSALLGRECHSIITVQPILRRTMAFCAQQRSCRLENGERELLLAIGEIWGLVPSQMSAVTFTCGTAPPCSDTSWPGAVNSCRSGQPLGRSSQHFRRVCCALVRISDCTCHLATRKTLPFLTGFPARY